MSDIVTEAKNQPSIMKDDKRTHDPEIVRMML